MKGKGLSISVGDIITMPDETKFKVVKSIESGNIHYPVFLLQDSAGDILALKTFKEPETDEKKAALFNTFKLASTINNKNVAGCLCYNDGKKQPDYPIFILMEYIANGSLLEYINQKKATGKYFSNEALKDLFLQIVDGVRAIHEVLVHRDIKTDNILMHGDVLKITDLASEQAMEIDSTSSNESKLNVYAETSGFDGARLDIYLTGLVFYELATLEHAFKGCENVSKTGPVISVNPKTLNNDLSDNLVSVIEKMISKDPDGGFDNWDEIIQALGREH